MYHPNAINLEKAFDPEINEMVQINKEFIYKIWIL